MVKKVGRERKINRGEVCCSDRERVLMPLGVECLLNVGSRGVVFRRFTCKWNTQVTRAQLSIHVRVVCGAC